MAVWLVIGSKCSEVRPIVSGIGTLILNRLVTIKSSTSLAGIQLVGVDKVFFNAEQLTREANYAPIPLCESANQSGGTSEWVMLGCQNINVMGFQDLCLTAGI
jgi:hypothetical protein